MPAQARLNDRTIGWCKIDLIWIGGTIITASENTFCNNLGVARKGDTVRSDCGHDGYIDTYSPNTFTNGLNNARLGDHYDGNYEGTIITGSPDTFTND